MKKYPDEHKPDPDVWREVPNRKDRRDKKNRPKKKTQPPWTNADWNTVLAPKKTTPTVDS